MKQLASAAVTRLRGLATPGFFNQGLWSFADQGLVSFANFLLMVLLARVLAPDRFGEFVLVYGALIFGANIQISLVTQPHNLLAASLEGEDYERYTASAMTNQILLAGGITLLILHGALGLLLIGSGATALLAGVGFASFAYQMQEFLRRERYTAGRSQDALAYDLISYGGQIVLLLLLWLTGWLTAMTALLAVGGTSALAVVYALWYRRIRPATEHLTNLQQSWYVGRWILSDSLGRWLSSDSFPILAALAAGPAAAGAYRALQNVVAPTNVLFNSLPSLVMPPSARAYANGGSKGLARFLVPVSIVIGLLFACYVFAVSALGPWILNLLYGSRHGLNASLIWLLALGYLTTYVTSIQSVAVLVLRRGRALAAARIAAIVVTLTVGVWLTWQFGVGGAFVGLFVAEVSRLVVLGGFLTRREPDEAEETRETFRTEAVIVLANAGGES